MTSTPAEHRPRSRTRRIDVRVAQPPAEPLPRPGVLRFSSAAERDQHWIDTAAYFTATIRIAPGTNRTHQDVRSLSDAGALAVMLELEHASGRRASVYAVTAEGRSAMVPREQWVAAVNTELAKCGGTRRVV